MAKQSVPGLFRGAAIDLQPRVRVLFTFLLSLIAISLCFSQLGVLSLDNSADGDFNLVLLLVPVTICATMLGVVPAIIVGVATGIALMFRSLWTPTNYFDMFLSDPLLSVAPIIIGSILMAVVVTLGERKWRSNQSPDAGIWKRVNVLLVIDIFVGCLLLCLCFSFGGRGALYILFPHEFELGGDLYAAFMEDVSSPFLYLEVLLNAVVTAAACVAFLILDANRRAGTWKSSVSSVFGRWLLLAMVVVFMSASVLSFCVETVRADRETSAAINAELDYVQQQIAYQQLQNASIDNLLSGYTASNQGTVSVVRNYIVVTSNDPNLVGQSVTGSVVASKEEFDDLASTEEQFTAYETDSQTFAVMRFRNYSGYTIYTFMPLPATYVNRTSTLMYNTALFLVLFAVVFFVAKSLLSGVVVEPIHRTNNTLELITEGDLQKRVNERNVVEFEALSKGINTTVAALMNSIEEAEQRNAQDLSTAKAIQESALPREFPPFPEIDRFDIYASMKTAKEVGGDFYDFFLIEDVDTHESKLGFVMADVSGKGIPAALFMMSAKTQIQTYMEAGLPVNEAVDAANHQLCIGNDAGMFVTAWVGVLDYATGLLSYVNAGHNPPLLLHDGTWEWMKNVSGMPLGLFDGIPYDYYERQIEPGDMLYTYTDGVTEAMNADGELFGEERLEATLYEYATFNPRSVGVSVRRALSNFTQDAEQSDDITMLILKYGVPPEKKAVMILPADDKQLVHVFNFIHEELHRRGAPKSVNNPLDIAAEELFVNVCHYAYPNATPENPGEVRISFEYEANPPCLTVQIADDGIPYNPLEKPDAVTPDDIMDVPIGGLGILMAKKSVDDMTYERVGESNVLTFKKAW